MALSADLTSICVGADMSIRDAMSRMDENGRRALLIVAGDRLCGVATEGDIRRWILRGGDLGSPLREVMTADPQIISQGEVPRAQTLMLENGCDFLPVVDEGGHLRDVVFLRDLLSPVKRGREPLHNRVVIMAGGKGERLAPITQVIPKPLVPIHGIPIVERIMNEFAEFGLTDFSLTVNYKKAMIKAYFADRDCPYTVRFVDEPKALGTAGSLRLLEPTPDNSFFVSNCDILLRSDYGSLLQQHKRTRATLTLVSSLKCLTVPYGVTELNDDGSLKTLVEKPQLDFFVNTGFYVLEPVCLDYIPDDRVFHMTDLIAALMADGRKVAVFPVSTLSWLDMGQMGEMEQMLRCLR